jgi:hypothetical protein
MIFFKIVALVLILVALLLAIGIGIQKLHDISDHYD